MKKNIAVIGCGYWGKNLVRNFAELGCLAAVCDPNIELAQSYAKTYSVENLSFTSIIKDKLMVSYLQSQLIFMHRWLWKL